MLVSGSVTVFFLFFFGGHGKKYAGCVCKKKLTGLRSVLGGRKRKKMLLKKEGHDTW